MRVKPFRKCNHHLARSIIEMLAVDEALEGTIRFARINTTDELIEGLPNIERFQAPVRQDLVLL